MEEKFHTLEEIAKDYISLIKTYGDEAGQLGKHVKFSSYGNRQKAISNLIEIIKDSKPSDEEKVKAIIHLTMPVSAKESIKVDFDKKKIEEYLPKNYPGLIHSYSNAARLSSILKHSEKDENDRTILKKDDVLAYGEILIEALEYLKNNDNIENFWENEKIKELAKQHLKSKINAPLNEIRFWLSDGETFPLVNGSFGGAEKFLKESITIDDKETPIYESLKKYFDDAKQSGTSFTYSTFLYIDQLYNLIHKLKVDEVRKESVERNDVLKFYEKIWHTIKDAKKEDEIFKISKFRNIIYHGAPGTSKTYTVKNDIENFKLNYGIGKYEFIQFHEAYYYEDFIGGLKPTKGDSLNLKFTNGIFKELCREAAKYEIAYYQTIPNAEELTEKTKLDQEWVIEYKDIGFKFEIEANKPVLSQFPAYFIIIDEINRADLSKVFGELLFAIEDDYRGHKHRFKLSSSAMEDQDTAVCWEDNQAYFFVPKNLYIRGTMNDIDKSVDSIDFAFRRRFKWIELKYDSEKLKDILKEKLSLKDADLKDEKIKNYIKSCENLNKKIIKDISIADESYKIGHAIFANIAKYVDNIDDIAKYKEELFSNHIEPIIYNYLKMDYGNEERDVTQFKEVFLK